MQITLRLPTLGEAVAAGRHVVTFSMGAIAMAAAFHLISQSDAGGLSAAITQITNGVVNITTGLEDIVAGISSIVAIFSAIWAARKQSPLAQVIAAADNPEVAHVVASPALAAKADHDKVVAFPMAA